MLIQPNTAQATGAMTLDQGVAAMKAKLADKGATAADTAIINTEVPDDETALETEGGLIEGQTDGQDDTEAVSTDDSQAEQHEPDTRPVLLPDGSEITVEEARKGYLRQSDFTRKTTDLARERESLAAERQAAAQQLGGLYQQLASLQETEPNWLQLANNPQVDAKQLQAAQAQWQHKRAVMNHTRQLLQNQQAQAEQSAKTKAFQVLNSGEYEPTWRDTKALQTGLATVTGYLTDNYPGIPQELLTSVSIPEVIVIADKARKWDELQKQKPKAALAVKGKPQSFRPGSKSTATPQSENIRLLDEAFRKNPTVDNAVALQKAKAVRR